MTDDAQEEKPRVRQFPTWPLELELGVLKKRDEDRPQCPHCGGRPPYRVISWCGPFGHRCPHDEPCPSFSKLEPTCTICVRP